MPRKKTTEEFIRDAKEKHGDKFGYDEVIYNSNKVNVQILCYSCDKHFPQTPDNHLQGKGCFRCKGKQIAESRKRKAAENFVSKAKKMHGDKYSYDEVIYNGARVVVNIFCIKCHKDFTQTPENHLAGSGCFRCAEMKLKQRMEDKKRKAAEAFVSKAKNIHGDTYRYHMVIYNGTNVKVDIVCNTCGEDFPQTPHNHLRGQGCPHCPNKTERIVCDKLHEELRPYGLKATLTGRINTKGVGQMDITIHTDDDKIIGLVEIDGGQHFKDVEKWRSKVMDVQKRDLEKHRRAIEKGYWVVRIEQEWVWDSHRRGKMDWIERLRETILKLTSNKKLSIDEMFLSNKANKYHEHLCYTYIKTVESSEKCSIAKIT